MPSANPLDRVEKIIDAARKAATTSQGRSQIDCALICAEGYAEPGYDDPKSGIIAFGNWNAVSRYDGRKYTDDAPKLDAEEFAEPQKAGPDPADKRRDALADASRQMDECHGQIKVATCDLSTGTASVRTVTPQEFVEGKALRR